MIKRILHLAHRVPFPPNKGDKIRSFHILNFLAQRHELYLATLVDDAKDMAGLPALNKKVQRLIYARIDQFGRKLFSIREVLRRRSITVRYFYSPRLQNEIDDLIEATEFDAILCSSSPMAEYLFRSRHRNERLIKMTKIMDLIDVDSYKWQQYAAATSGPKAWVYRYEAGKLAKYERCIYEYFQSILFVSEQEKAYFPMVDTKNKLHAVSNGVDLQYFDNTSEDTGGNERPTLVFTGMMDYWPNIEGMRWFIKHVFPGVRDSIPTVRLLVVGGRPTREVMRWRSIKGIEVTGFVEDIREYLEIADVCIAPLRIARGIQNKVLEAMAMRKAVVATPQALEGINLTPGTHAVSANSAKEFGAATIELLQDKRRACVLGQEARQCVEQYYSWGARLQSINSLLLKRP